jgi:hypothetical protein
MVPPSHACRRRPTSAPKMQCQRALDNTMSILDQTTFEKAGIVSKVSNARSDTSVTSQHLAVGTGGTLMFWRAARMVDPRCVQRTPGSFQSCFRLSRVSARCVSYSGRQAADQGTTSRGELVKNTASRNNDAGDLTKPRELLR